MNHCKQCDYDEIHPVVKNYRDMMILILTPMMGTIVDPNDFI